MPTVKSAPEQALVVLILAVDRNVARILEQRADRWVLEQRVFDPVVQLVLEWLSAGEDGGLDDGRAL